MGKTYRKEDRVNHRKNKNKKHLELDNVLDFVAFKQKKEAKKIESLLRKEQEASKKAA